MWVHTSRMHPTRFLSFDNETGIPLLTTGLLKEDTFQFMLCFNSYKIFSRPVFNSIFWLCKNYQVLWANASSFWPAKLLILTIRADPKQAANEVKLRDNLSVCSNIYEMSQAELFADYSSLNSSLSVQCGLFQHYNVLSATQPKEQTVQRVHIFICYQLMKLKRNFHTG